VIAEHGVKALFTAPTAFWAIKKEDPAGELARKYDLTPRRSRRDEQFAGRAARRDGRDVGPA
jgi:hypothetical protein